MAVVLTRLRMPLVWASVGLLIVASFLDIPWWLPLIGLAAALAIYFCVGTVRRPAMQVFAAGLPLSFDSFEVAGQQRAGVPAGAESFVVDSPSAG